MEAVQGGLPPNIGNIFLPGRSGLNLDGFARTCGRLGPSFVCRLSELVFLRFFRSVNGLRYGGRPRRGDSRKIVVRLRREQCRPYMLADVFAMEIGAVTFDNNILTVKTNADLILS
jgi:hypothetical protein